MRLSTILSMVFFLFISSACKKDDSPSQTGSNSMSAKVDGKSWSRKPCWECIGGGKGLRIDYDDRDYFALQGQDPDFGMTIEFAIYSMPGVGTYQLNSTYSLSNKNINVALLFKNNKEYTTTEQSTGVINITKVDLLKKIVSGTFTFTAEEEGNPANTIQVTDGRFDVTFL